MSTQKVIEIVIMEGIAVAMFILAYFIGVKGRMELIAGYNEKTAHRVKDKDGLKRLITRMTVLVGAGCALMPLITYYAFAANSMDYVLGGFGGFLLGAIGMVILQAREYT